MDFDGDLLRTLTEIGFMAAGHGRRKEAQAIFDGLAAVRPESEYPTIGLAVADIGVGKYDDAIAILRNNVLRQKPDNADALCFLGLALKLAGRGSESEATLRQAAKSASDERTRSLAEALLN